MQKRDTFHSNCLEAKQQAHLLLFIIETTIEFHLSLATIANTRVKPYDGLSTFIA